MFMFSGRGGGVSAAPYDTMNLGRSVGDDPAAVTANRHLAAQACGVAPERLTWMHQAHGSTVWHAAAVPAAPGDREPPQADAMYTDVAGPVLVVQVADCGPVLLADPLARVIGAAHAGREGMASGVVTELITAMSAAGADPARMHAVIGPHICGGCYEVPEEMRARVAGKVPESGCVTRAGSPGIDIRAGVGAQLERAGVRTVTHDRRCTAESPELFSYRRDGRTGRLAGFVWLP
jgi:YfiH family protein